MEPVRVGIIGCGRIADLQIKGYIGNPEARIHAICDLRPDVLERRRQEWGASRTYTDAYELLRDPDVEMVEIITPHHLHRDLTVAACQAGKHVSVQKPMALSVPECDQMIAAAREAGVKLKVYENFVFYPPYVKARELLAEGAIGDPLFIRLRIGGAGWGAWEVPMKAWVWRFIPDMAGGGPMVFDDGYHKFSVAVHLMGAVEQVHAWVDSTFGFIDAPAMITWTHKEGGRTGLIDVTFSPHMAVRTRYYAVDERVEIVGSEGVLTITRCTGRLLDEPPLLLTRKGQTLSFDDIRSDWEDSFIDSTRHFVRVLRNGGDPLLSGEQGREVLQFVLGAIRSAESGRSVRPDSVV